MIVTLFLQVYEHLSKKDAIYDSFVACTYINLLCLHFSIANDVTLLLSNQSEL